MAGIGFRIEKILAGDTYFDVIKAHFYSAIIFSGPWLLSIVTLFCLGYFSPDNIRFSEIVFFKTVLIYIFAFSLIFVGFFQLSLTRYLSDKLYIKEEESLVPIFNASLLLVLVLQSLIGIAVINTIDIPFIQKFLIVMIYLTISAIWIIMLFLTALRDYEAISWAFVIGSFVAVTGSIYLGQVFGLEGYFAGYFIGHLIICAMLTVRIFTEFGSRRFFDWGVLNFLAKNKTLVFLGFFYNLAIWIDKIIFWFSPKAIQINNFLYSYPQYESATFFAYLTIVPALSIFIIHIETDFYKKYKLYYTQILDKGAFSQILAAKKNMMASLRESLAFVATTQGIISLLAITFSAPLANIFHLQAIQIPVFRISVVGAFLHSLLLIGIIIILYFDFKKTALMVTGVFLISNAVGTWITSRLSLPFVGYGYLGGALIALITAFYCLDYKLKRLEYITFATQPLAAHREEELI